MTSSKFEKISNFDYSQLETTYHDLIDINGKKIKFESNVFKCIKDCKIDFGSYILKCDYYFYEDMLFAIKVFGSRHSEYSNPSQDLILYKYKYFQGSCEPINIHFSRLVFRNEIFNDYASYCLNINNMHIVFNSFSSKFNNSNFNITYLYKPIIDDIIRQETD